MALFGIDQSCVIWDPDSHSFKQRLLCPPVLPLFPFVVILFPPIERYILTYTFKREYSARTGRVCPGSQ